jgi:hypothetical protein
MRTTGRGLGYGNILSISIPSISELALAPICTLVVAVPVLF